jgi:DNA-binding MarR family transcriptional regulator
MISEKSWLVTHEIFILGAVIAKNTMYAAEKNGLLADEGITMLQYGVLRRLRRDNLTIAELSKFLMVDPSTLVSVIDALVRKGLVQRKRDPNDRRRIPIMITEQGNTVVSMHPDHGPFTAENPLVQSIDALGFEKSQQLLLLLREVVSHMPDGNEILEHISKRVQYHAAKVSRKEVD